MNAKLPSLLAVGLSLMTLVGGARIAMAQSIIEAQGEVHLKSGASSFRPVKAGTLLKDGDILKTSNTAKVTVMCDNNSLWRVPPGVVSGVRNGCPPDLVTRVRRGKESQPGGSNPAIPYLLSPRMTYLFNALPAFLTKSAIANRRSLTE